LLKILEEPPPRVIFVFATTEPQKIQQSAAPLLSRCQRFDFHRIPVPGLVGLSRGRGDALRTLLVIRFDDADAADIREDLRPAFAAVAGRFGPGDLVRMLAMVAELDTEGRFRKSANPRTMLETLLLRFAYLDRTVRIEELLAGAGEEGEEEAWP